MNAKIEDIAVATLSPTALDLRNHLGTGARQDASFQVFIRGHVQVGTGKFTAVESQRVGADIAVGAFGYEYKGPISVELLDGGTRGRACIGQTCGTGPVNVDGSELKLKQVELFGRITEVAAGRQGAETKLSLYVRDLGWIEAWLRPL